MQAFTSGKEGRELSPQERLEADPFSDMNILAAMWEEVQLVEWPKPGTVVRQTVVTAVVLVGAVTFIVTLDEGIKNLYQAVGLYPK